MPYKLRAIVIAMIIFIPTYGLLWFCAPWSTSRADFALTGATLFDEVRSSFSGRENEPANWSENLAWLQSEKSVKVILNQLPNEHLAALMETGDSWGVRLRERLRIVSCSGLLGMLRFEDLTICSWIGQQLGPRDPATSHEIVEERLTIGQNGDRQHVQIAFRASDPNVASTIVDAFGDALLERQDASRHEWRQLLIKKIKNEIAEVTEDNADLEISSKDGKIETEEKKSGPDILLATKFSDAMKRAKEELPIADRRRLSQEFEAIDAIARVEPMSETLILEPVVDRKKAYATAPVDHRLTLLAHPDWSKPSVVRLSTTTGDGFSAQAILAIAFVVSLIIGIVVSLIWPNPQRRSDRRNDFYASPYANPHWPNMRFQKGTKMEKAA